MLLNRQMVSHSSLALKNGNWGDCWDGVSEDLEFYGEHENEEAIKEKYEEGDDFTSSILEEFGFESDDMELFLWNEIEIEEAEEQEPY